MLTLKVQEVLFPLNKQQTGDAGFEEIHSILQEKIGYGSTACKIDLITALI